MIRRLVSAAMGLAALALTTTPARADIVPSGYKSVKLSIQIEGEVPAGRTLLLINTWEGATKLTPGEAVKVDWHPLHGKLQLVSVTAAQLAAIEAIAQQDRSEARMPKMQAKSTPCAEPFDGVRTVKDTERYDEIRWHYTVRHEEDACHGKLTRTAHLADGEDLEPRPSASATATPAPESKPTEEIPKSATTASDPPKAAPATPASTCTTSGAPAGAPGSDAGWLLVGLAVMGARAGRRRRSPS